MCKSISTAQDVLRCEYESGPWQVTQFLDEAIILLSLLETRQCDFQTMKDTFQDWEDHYPDSHLTGIVAFKATGAFANKSFADRAFLVDSNQPFFTAAIHKGDFIRGQRPNGLPCILPPNPRAEIDYCMVLSPKKAERVCV